MFETILAGFGADLAAEAAKIGTQLGALAVKAGDSAVADFATVLKEVAPIAARAVVAQAKLVATGKQKFSAAVVAVWQALEARIGPVAQQDVHALVQMTYQGLVKIGQSAV